MRKPRDFDSELKALTDKTKQLKDSKVQQLGELVIATGADTAEPEILTGALIGIVETKDAATREGWRNRGAAFFRSQSRRPARKRATDAQGDQARQGDGPSH